MNRIQYQRWPRYQRDRLRYVELYSIDPSTTSSAASEPLTRLPTMRCEVAVRTNLVFHTKEPPYALLSFPEPETVVIEFEGRRYVWHEPGPDPDGEARWPVVTTMVADPDDYAAERLAIQRFLSALTYWTSMSIEVVGGPGGAGGTTELDPPVVSALRRGLANHIYNAPGEMVVTNDPSLRRVLGYFREGENTESPFFRFLAFWNALDVACEDVGLRAWIRANAARFAHHRGDAAQTPSDWWDYLQDERRSAVAHAVRDPGRGPELDPDDPEDRVKLYSDSRFIRELVRERVRERWGDYAVQPRRRTA